MDVNVFYHKDICISIFKTVSDIRNLLNLTLLSTHHNILIKEMSWDFRIHVYSDKTLDYILENYNFTNLVIGIRCDVNKFAQKLNKCHGLDVAKTNINDESVKIITSYGKCSKWNLSETSITDECTESFNKLKISHFVNFLNTNVNGELLENTLYQFVYSMKKTIKFEDCKFALISDHNGFDIDYQSREYAMYLNDLNHLGLISEEKMILRNTDINIITFGNVKNEVIDRVYNIRGLFYLVVLPGLINNFEKNKNLLCETDDIVYSDYGVCTEDTIQSLIINNENNITITTEIPRLCDIMKYITIMFDEVNLINFGIKIFNNDECIFSTTLKSEKNSVNMLPIYLNMLYGNIGSMRLVIECENYNEIFNPDKIIIRYGRIMLNPEIRQKMHSEKLFLFM